MNLPEQLTNFLSVHNCLLRIFHSNNCIQLLIKFSVRPSYTSAFVVDPSGICLSPPLLEYSAQV